MVDCYLLFVYFDLVHYLLSSCECVSVSVSVSVCVCVLCVCVVFFLVWQQS